MAKKLTPEEELNTLKGKIPDKDFENISHFVREYLEAVSDVERASKILFDFLHLAKKQFKNPFSFKPYHKKIREPFDYYKFGIDFLRPLVDLPHSKLLGEKNLDQIEKQLKIKENVVLLANHQTETDPQAISIMLEENFEEVGESVIYVAGERVVTDPLAIPFSMGCDLLCIYSKRYIDYPPELKTEKQLHNKKTMGLMSELLKEGGKIIYVAPSGGRDRKNEKGEVTVAPFDPDSIEMFYLMAKKSKTPTHFYPLALATYDLLPPPETIQKELGEKRVAKRASIAIEFLDEFDMENFPGSEEKNKLQRRMNRASTIHSIVEKKYQYLQGEI